MEKMGVEFASTWQRSFINYKLQNKNDLVPSELFVLKLLLKPHCKPFFVPQYIDHPLKHQNSFIFLKSCSKLLTTKKNVFFIMIKYYSGFYSKVFIKLFIFATFRTVLLTAFKLFTYSSLQKSRLQLRNCHQPSHAHAFQNYLYARAHASVFRFTI